MANETDAHEQWRKILIEGHRPLRILHSLFRYLPGPPRCAKGVSIRSAASAASWCD
jgi:hypothetical protein